MMWQIITKFAKQNIEKQQRIRALPVFLQKKAKVYYRELSVTWYCLSMKAL